jgi:hypothetical protein
VVHNTFVLNGVHPDSGARWGGGISIENDQVDTLVIRNNLVAWGSAFQIEGEAIDGLHDEIGLQLDHNLVWGELGYYMEIGDQGAGSLAADPLLADTAARDFSLTASSPAVDAGLVHPGIEEDYEGDLRFIGEGVDIGADELDYTSAPERLPAALRPDQPRLAPAWPNPFNGRVSLRIQLPTSSSVELAVYDLQGRLVALLEDGRLAEGEHRFHWQPDDAASGTYLVRLRSGARTQTRKVVLLR